MASAASSLPPWESAAFAWAAHSTGIVLLNVAFAALLTLLVGSLATVRAQQHRTLAPPLGRVQQIAFALPALLLLALLRSRMPQGFAAIEVSSIVGVLGGLELGRCLYELELRAGRTPVLKSATSAIARMWPLWRTHRQTLALSAARAAAGCIGLDALLTHFGFARETPTTWGELLGAVSAGSATWGSSATFALVASMLLPWGIFVLCAGWGGGKRLRPAAP